MIGFSKAAWRFTGRLNVESVFSLAIVLG